MAAVSSAPTDLPTLPIDATSSMVMLQAGLVPHLPVVQSLSPEHTETDASHARALGAVETLQELCELPMQEHQVNAQMPKPEPVSSAGPRDLEVLGKRARGPTTVVYKGSYSRGYVIQFSQIQRWHIYICRGSCRQIP